jgi:predicted AAA+ superfamily ATPase
MKAFLWSVNLYQYQKTLTEICKLASFTAGTGSRLAKRCEKRNLIKVVQIKIGKGSPKYPVLLQPAYETLGIKEKHFWGKGAGHEHVLYQHLIAKHFSEILPEARVTIELHRGEKHIDVGIETNERLIAVEVAMTSSHEIINIQKDMQNAKADLVIVACKDERVTDVVHTKLSQLSSELRNKVRVCLVGEVLKNGRFVW